MTYPSDMDKECIRLCDALNALPGITTHASCCGHGKDPFRVFFRAQKIEDLAPVLRCTASSGWHVEAWWTNGAGLVVFILEGPIGDLGEDLANWLADDARRSKVREHRDETYAQENLLDAKKLAALLSGKEYPLRISAELRAQASAAGLVIVYGASDDLMEFNGAIDDEIGVCGGIEVEIDKDDVIRDWDSIVDNDLGNKDIMRDYFRREGRGKKIEALWSPGDGYSWKYETDIPHETFEIVEGGAPYCRGIVFAIVDLG